MGFDEVLLAVSKWPIVRSQFTHSQASEDGVTGLSVATSVYIWEFPQKRGYLILGSL